MERREFLLKAAAMAGLLPAVMAASTMPKELRRPLRSSRFEPAVMLSNADWKRLAESIQDGRKAGGVLVLPNTRDENNDLVWDFDHR